MWGNKLQIFALSLIFLMGGILFTNSVYGAVTNITDREVFSDTFFMSGAHLGGLFIGIGNQTGNTTQEIWGIVDNGTFPRFGLYIGTGNQTGNTSNEIWAVVDNGTFPRFGLYPDINNATGNSSEEIMTTVNSSNINTTGYIDAIAFLVNGLSTNEIYLFLNGSNYNATFEALINDTIDARTISKTYNATSNVTIDGTWDIGNLSSMSIRKDGFSYNVSEDAGTNPLKIEINFTGVTDFDFIDMRIWYDGGLGHEIEIGMFDYTTGLYEEEYGEITDQPNFRSLTITVRDASDHLSGETASLQFRHTGTGINSHNFFIDYIGLIEGFSTTTNDDHDGLSGRDSTSNHPWALAADGSRALTANWINPFNISVDTILGKWNNSGFYEGNTSNQIWGVIDNGTFPIFGLYWDTGNGTIVTNTTGWSNYANKSGIADSAIISRGNTSNEMWGVCDNGTFPRFGLYPDNNNETGNTSLEMWGAIDNGTFPEFGLYIATGNQTGNNTPEIHAAMNSTNFETGLNVSTTDTLIGNVSMGTNNGTFYYNGTCIMIENVDSGTYIAIC